MNWNKTCKEFKTVRKAIDAEKTELIIKQLIAICEKYAKMKWDFSEDYESLAEDLSELSIEELETEDVDYWLGEFYDLCDNARVFLDL